MNPESLAEDTLLGFSANSPLILIMVAKESSCDGDHHHHHHQLHHDFDNDGAETLSLCDLVESSNWNSSDHHFSSISKEESNHQSASDDQDFFEFFSEDFTAASAASAYPKDSIIFCGKLIPYKQEASAHPEQTQKQNKIVNDKKSRIFPWRSSSNSFKMSRSTSSKAQSQQGRGSYCTTQRALSQRKGYTSYSYEYEHDLSSPMLATSVKPRWYLLAFGHGRFPSEMKLRDIKNRQSRRRAPATMFPSEDGSEAVERSSEKRSSSSPWKGFWTFLKVLGCKGQRANAVVRLGFN